MKEDINGDPFFVFKLTIEKMRIVFLIFRGGKMDIPHYDVSIVCSCLCHFGALVLCLKR